MYEKFKAWLCTCLTKRPEPEYHTNECPVTKAHDELQQLIAEALLEAADNERQK